ncbi:MAG: DUF4111 domain-containing protein [Limnochordia bacterium]
MAGQHWDDCDEDVKLFTLELVKRIKDPLDSMLTGVYLHGSLAMGSYYRPKSDIDLIVVVDAALDAALAEEFGVMIATHACRRPTLGDVELSVITAEVAKHVPVPTPFEVHYSSQWHDRILKREVDYTCRRTDADLCSHLTYVVQCGIRLAGKPIPEVFGDVEWRHFMASVLDDCNWILEGNNILETPYYGVLNICRILQLLSQDTQEVHSKDEGGEWALAHLPDRYHSVIRQALDVYRSAEAVTEEQGRTGGKIWDANLLLALRDFARLQIERMTPGTHSSSDCDRETSGFR